MFAVFGESRLEYIENTASSAKIAEWKTSQKTRNAYNELFKNHDLLLKIGYLIFKQFKDKEFPLTHCTYILSICDIVLNSKSSEIKCNDRAVVRRMNAFLVNIICNTLKFK